MFGKKKTGNNETQTNETQVDNNELVELNIKIPKKVYDDYMILFNEVKKNNKNKTDEQIHGDLFTDFFFYSLFNK